MVAIRARPNGGKSTLLHILGGLQRPDSGLVQIDGQDVTQLEDEELARVRLFKVGFAFEAFNLLPNETALRNVEVPLRHQGIGAGDTHDKARRKSFSLWGWATAWIIGLDSSRHGSGSAW